MKNLKAPSLVTIGILTVITIVFWIAFEIFRIFTVKPAPPVPQQIIEPLDPTLDGRALDRLQQRIFLTEGEIGTTVIQESTPTPVPTPIPEPTPIATESAVPAATESAGTE